MGYGHEVDLVAAARALDLLTTPYVFDEEEARLMTKAGADIVVAHMGLTTKGRIGAVSARSLEDCVTAVRRIVDVCKALRDDSLVLCHGGPIAEPADAQSILERVPGCDGFYGASSMERLPTEIAVTAQVERFAAIRLGRRGTR